MSFTGFDWCCGTSSNETIYGPGDICWWIPSRWVFGITDEKFFPAHFTHRVIAFCHRKTSWIHFSEFSFRIFCALCFFPSDTHFLFALSFIYNRLILLSLVLMQQNIRTNGSLCNSRHVPSMPSWFVHKVVIREHNVKWRNVNRDAMLTKNAYRDIGSTKKDSRDTFLHPDMPFSITQIESQFSWQLDPWWGLHLVFQRLAFWK